MSNKNYQNKNQNLFLDNKKVNINLISNEKNQNNIENLNKNNQNNNIFSNDLINTKNEDDLNLSNINIEKTQKFLQNADFLFPEDEDENQNEGQNNNNYINNKNKSRNLNNSIESYSSKDVININEEKRIENANNLFGNSFSSSMKSNINNDINQSLVSEKRREFANELFQTFSSLNSKKKSLNDTMRTNMSHAINNLSGSNFGLNINEIANKYVDNDKVIYDEEEANNINNIEYEDNKNNLNLKNSKNKETINDNDIDEQSEKEISFRKNLIEFKNNVEIDNNNSNNLNNLPKKNNLIKSNNSKNELDSNKKEKYVNNLNNESKKNLLNYNNKENINNSNSEINLSNIDFDNLPKINNGNNVEKNKEKEEKKNIINENINIQKDKDDENIISKDSVFKKPNFSELFKKNKNKYKKDEEKKITIIDKDDDVSSDILNKKIRINTNENNESSIINTNKIPSRISIDDDNPINLKRKILNKKAELIKEKDQSIINTEEKEVSKISNNISQHLITEKSALPQGVGRNNLLDENDQNKFIVLKKGKKKDNEYEYKDEEDKSEKNENKINYNKNINMNKNKIQISSSNEKKLVYFNDKSLNEEKKFEDFLKSNNLYFNKNIYNEEKEEENNNQLEQIKENSYFENYIIKQETLYDLISKNKKKLKKEIPYYYDIMKKTYEKNKKNFVSLFQFITINDKKKFFKLYQTFQNYNIGNYSISPHLNDINNFNDCFKIENKNNNLNYIRYTIDENVGDTFYRCFMFSLIEKYILNKQIENINMIIFDIFKLYDLSPTIFTSNKNCNINNVLIFFSIINDYIQLNLWEKIYDFYLSIYSQIDKALILYIKYNIFLLLSKIYTDNDEYKSKYLNQYKKIFINYNEPTLIIFQLIPFIFGINLEIIYYENKNKDNSKIQNISFTCPKLLGKNNTNTIYIIYCNNCYHIGYQKKDFENNKKIFKKINENLNIISLIQYIKNDKIFCELCDKNTDYIEIANDNNKGICSDCLSKKIDEYLFKRISFIKNDSETSYINYSYYIRPIELFLKEPISIKNNIENNSIVIKSIDYYFLYEKSFSQRISELFSSNKDSKIKNIKLENSIIKDNDDDFINDNLNEICYMCQKSSNILTSECGCKICEDCLYEILMSITNNQIILNGYEKTQLSMNDTDKCPLCEKNLNLSFLVMQFEERGRNFEAEYNEAKVRMRNYCKTICYNCEKKFTNEKSLEVSHNSRRDMLQINVMINKHCLKDLKKNNENNIEMEKGIDYNDSLHVICLDCYKKDKNEKIKTIKEIEYKVIICNICGIKHYVNMRDWDRWKKNDVCCKCNIF